MRRHHAGIWRKRRRQAVASWYDESGAPLQDLASVGVALSSYWGKLYLHADYDSEVAEDCLRFVQVSDGAGWSWERGCTRELAAVVRDSSPGQDGLSYAFWAEAPPFARDLLDDVAEAAQDGGKIPPARKDSITGTIPKVEVVEDVAVVCCTAGTMPRMARMQTGRKLVALRANTHLSAVVGATGRCASERVRARAAHRGLCVGI